MSLDIAVNGKAKLMDVYENKINGFYYALLSVYFDTSIDFLSSSSEIKVRITKGQYDSLKEQIDSFDAESPVLRVKGRIELKVSS